MKIIFGIFISLAFGLSVSAQTANFKIEKEIADFRAEIREAVKAKDRKSLERFFADGFTHTHASGKVDEKPARIDFFIKGEPTIEDVEPDEFRIVVFGKNLASVIGRSTLRFGTEQRTFQWTGVYRKDKGKWKVLATHATLVKT